MDSAEVEKASSEREERRSLSSSSSESSSEDGGDRLKVRDNPYRKEEITIFRKYAEIEKAGGDVPDSWPLYARLQDNAKYRLKTMKSLLRFASLPTHNFLRNAALYYYFYKNWEGDLECAFCHMSVYNWDRNTTTDELLALHYRLAPYCEAVRGGDQVPDA